MNPLVAMLMSGMGGGGGGGNPLMGLLGGMGGMGGGRRPDEDDERSQMRPSGLAGYAQRQFMPSLMAGGMGNLFQGIGGAFGGGPLGSILPIVASQLMRRR